MQAKTAAEAAELINSRIMQGRMTAEQEQAAAEVIERFAAAVLYTGQEEEAAEVIKLCGCRYTAADSLAAEQEQAAEQCTCRGLEDGEHYLTCPTVLTEEVKAAMGI